tara:strand:- start:17488 stop:17853 length:366 start_codon:yes stop_codon:yes gene_type:complete
MRDFRELKVWEKSHRLALRVYQQTKGFPSDERFGLTSQIRRATASVPTNLAEGCGRRTDKDLAHFCDIAMGSASESEYQLLLARDLGYIDKAEHREIEDELLEVKKMLNGFISAVRSRIDN